MGLAPILVEQIFKIIQTLHEAGTTILLVEPCYWEPEKSSPPAPETAVGLPKSKAYLGG